MRLGLTCRTGALGVGGSSTAARRSRLGWISLMSGTHGMELHTGPVPGNPDCPLCHGIPSPQGDCPRCGGTRGRVTPAVPPPPSAPTQADPAAAGPRPPPVPPPQHLMEARPEAPPSVASSQSEAVTFPARQYITASPRGGPHINISSGPRAPPLGPGGQGSRPAQFGNAPAQPPQPQRRQWPPPQPWTPTVPPPQATPPWREDRERLNDEDWGEWRPTGRRGGGGKGGRKGK